MVIEKSEITMINRQFIRTVSLVALCFLLTSTAYLAWTYHIMALIEAPAADAITMSAAYPLQAAGIGLFALFSRRREDQLRISLYVVLALHMLLLVPAALGASLVQALVFGLAQNVCCGWIAGYYLYFLTIGINANTAGRILGIGYSFAIVFNWLMSAVGNGAVRHSRSILVVCLIFTVILFYMVRRIPADIEPGEEPMEPAVRFQLPREMSLKSFLVLAGALIILFSIVNSCGFGFPSGDLENGVSLEFSRLFYAAGLVIAGYVNDKNRRYGAICAVVVLVIPFLMLAIRGEPVSLMVFWALSYFTFGFYTVFRIILLSDMARAGKLLWLSGAGLMLGRVGDALGEALCLALAERYLVLIGVTAILFMISVLIFFRLYNVLYMPEASKERSEQEIFNHFSARHDLSAREREVLRFLLRERTNQEIADELSISEGTVKYHIHNILQKTSCRNRLALLAKYAAEQDA